MRNSLALSKEEMGILMEHRCVHATRRVSPPFGEQEDWSFHGGDPVRVTLLNQEILKDPRIQKWGAVQALRHGATTLDLEEPFSGKAYGIKETWDIESYAERDDGYEVLVRYVEPQELRLVLAQASEFKRFVGRKKQEGSNMSPLFMPMAFSRIQVRCTRSDFIWYCDHYRWNLRLEALPG